jgi:hypothetical protein
MQLVAVVISGLAVKINAAEIPQEHWKTHSGIFNGTPVNSLQSCEVGESTIIRQSRGRGQSFSAPTADVMLYAQQALEARGMRVVAAEQRQTA